MLYMLCTETERRKIATEIDSVSTKIAQEKYAERAAQVVKEVLVNTGVDISSVLEKVPKKD